MAFTGASAVDGRRNVESGQTLPPVRRVGLVAARSKPEAAHLGREVADWLRDHGLEVVPEQSLGIAGTVVDAVVVFGGDGLMMRAANAYPDVPLLGINFGNVGFLALVERRDWRAALENLVGGRFTVEQGSTLAAAVVRGDEVHDAGWAINDVVLKSGARMIDVELYIDGHYVNTYPGDGMIVSTPHGSTAYGMAAGGPILTAGVSGFAIVPISCHSPIRMPLVVSEDEPIELLVANDREATLILDGRETTTLRQGDLVRVTRGEHLFRLVTFGTTNFYEAFRTKFNFMIRPNAVPSLPIREDGRRVSTGEEADQT